MLDFSKLNLEDKDELTCDYIFCMYLRHVSKYVNELFYKNVLRFTILYWECLNEYGWLKRREHYEKAGMLKEDTILNKLKADEEKEEMKLNEEANKNEI